MTFFETYGKEVVALLVPLLTWGLNTLFKARAKLLLASPHTFTFLVHEPQRDAEGNVTRQTQTVQTRSLMVWNGGRETATKVEWLLNWKPFCVNVWPPRNFLEQTAPDGRYSMTFESLAPNEYLGCEILSVNVDLPALLTVRSDQCVAQTVNMYPQPVVENWQRRLGRLFWLAGLGAVVYLTIILVQFLVLKTPFGH